MKVAALIRATVAAATGAQAAVVGYVQTPQGRIEVHDERGAPVSRALMTLVHGDRPPE